MPPTSRWWRSSFSPRKKKPSNEEEEEDRVEDEAATSKMGKAMASVLSSEGAYLASRGLIDEFGRRGSRSTSSRAARKKATFSPFLKLFQLFDKLFEEEARPPPLAHFLAEI